MKPYGVTSEMLYLWHLTEWSHSRIALLSNFCFARMRTHAAHGKYKIKLNDMVDVVPRSQVDAKRTSTTHILAFLVQERRSFTFV